MEGFKRGELAKKAMVSIETLRYYEQNELLPKPRRTAKNYRIYSDDSLKRIRFIKRAQQLGFSLKEIKALISLRTDPRADCGDVKKITLSKVNELDSKIKELKLMKKSLVKLESECPDRGPIKNCRMLETLESEKYEIC
jgi:MerR family mercuric resistance operon transcriptional regulator